MRYKGYVGTIEYSNGDGCFIGHIHGLRDIITFEGESVRELRADFENAVDSYLATCVEIGKSPQKQVSGKMLLRLPADLHYQLTLQAEARGESVNSLVVEAVETACKRDGRRIRKPEDRTAKAKPRRKRKATTAG